MRSELLRLRAQLAHTPLRKRAAVLRHIDRLARELEGESPFEIRVQLLMNRMAKEMAMLSRVLTQLSATATAITGAMK